MFERPRGKTDKLNRPVTGGLRSPEGNAVEIYHHQRRAEALAKYAPMVVPLLKDVLLNTFGSTPGYGVDDNIDVDADVMRFGWRIFGLGEAEMQFGDEMPRAGERKTLLAVELLFGEMGNPTAFMVDTRRTRTMVKTGLLGLKQRIQVASGSARKAALNETDLKEALDEIAPTMER